jgi:hypothetical protein
MAAKSVSLVGAAGMVLIEYIGQNAGTETWQPDPKRRYELGGSNRLGYVDKLDVEWFLTRRDHNGLLFKLAAVVAEPVLSMAEAEAVNPGAAATQAAPTVRAVEPAEKLARQKAAMEHRRSIDPADYSIKSLLGMDLNPDEWELILEREKAGLNRKSLIKAIESHLD